MADYAPWEFFSQRPVFSPLFHFVIPVLSLPGPFTVRYGAVNDPFTPPSGKNLLLQVYFPRPICLSLVPFPCAARLRFIRVHAFKVKGKVSFLPPAVRIGKLFPPALPSAFPLVGVDILAYGHSTPGVDSNGFVSPTVRPSFFRSRRLTFRLLFFRSNVTAPFPRSRSEIHGASLSSLFLWSFLLPSPRPRFRKPSDTLSA